MNSLFEVSFTTLAETGQFLSRCGNCFHYLRFVKQKPQRLYCVECNQVYISLKNRYNLPQNGTIKLYSGHKCPIDRFELLLYSLGNTIGKQGMTSPFCPNCYHNPPFEDIAKPMVMNY